MSLSDPGLTHRSTLTTGLDWWFGGRILRPIRGVVAALFVTSGPWLVLVFALAVAGITMEPVIGRAGLEDLRLTVVYAFCLAPLAAGPIGVVAARLIRHSKEYQDGSLVSEIFLMAILFAGAASQAMAVLICLGFGISPFGIATAFVFLAAAAAALWVSFAVLASLNAHSFLIGSFSAGMCLTLGCLLVAGSYGPMVETMVWSFTAGILCCVGLSLWHVARGFPDRPRGLVEAAGALTKELRAQAALCAGVVFMLSGVWVDKWVLWFGPDSMQSGAGFRHFGTYDSVMFVAHFSMIPTFVMMFLLHEGDLVRGARAFHRVLRQHTTYDGLGRAMATLQQSTWAGLARIVFVQITLTITLVLLAPMIGKVFDFTFHQFLVLRVGLVAVFLYSIVYLSSVLLIVCARYSQFLMIQLLFFVLNGVFSIAMTAAIGWSAYPIFLSSLVVAILSLFLAERALRSYDYLVFVGENAGLYDAAE